ncbi:MAG: hydroxymethylglutaryl-CoA lyase [Devosia sp.]
MEKVEIVEVSPRDGIQNEPKTLSLKDKRELIELAIRAGAKRIEVGSFVNPKRVPQMAGSEELMASLPRHDGVSYIGLTLNRRGFERALAARVHEVTFVVVASETFNQRNQGTGTFESLRVWNEIAAEAAGKMRAGVTIGAAFGCPFEGEVPLSRLLAVVEAAIDADPCEIGLADTIGVAVPRDIRERVGAVKERYPDIPIRLHLHNTRNMGYANAWAGIEAGVASLDSSLGGVGGCPFAPRATGNIATEDLVYMLERSGVETGIDLDAAIDAARWLEEKLEKQVPGQLMKAGPFPPHNEVLAGE